MRSHPTTALPTYIREQDACNRVIRDQVLHEAACDGYHGRSTPPSPHVVPVHPRLPSPYNAMLAASGLRDVHIVQTNKHIATSSKPRQLSASSTQQLIILSPPANSFRATPITQNTTQDITTCRLQLPTAANSAATFSSTTTSSQTHHNTSVWL
jgi:hypothetical protein